MPGDVAQFERGHEIAPAPYDKATAVVAATMLFADYIIEGGFTLGPVDGSITVHARLVDGTTGEEVFVAHASGGDLKSVATLLGKQMRDRLRFERSVPVSNGLWPASEVAAEDYGMALLAARSGKDTELLQLLSRTLAVEPTFEQASWMQKAMSTMLDRVLDGNRDPDLHSLPRDDAESAQIAMATARRTSTAAETASAARFAADPFDIELHLKALEVMASPTLETIDELRRLKATANLLQYPLFSYAEIGMWARRKSWISVMAMAAQATSDARGAHDALLLIGEESLVASAAEELTAWDTELSYASEAVDTARRIGNAVMVSRNHDSIVRALQKQGLFTRLETSIRASIADARRRGDEAAAKEDEITLASLMIETGRVEHAHRSLETVITPYFLSGEGVREGNYAQLEAARAALALGQLASAERDALASLSYYRAQNNDRLVAYARTLVANIAFARGGLDVARARATEALNARVAGHLMRVASQSRIQLAMIDIAAGQPAQAEHDLLAVLVDPAASCLMRDRAEASAYRALALLALDRDADALRSIDDARRFAADFESVPLALLVGRVRALVIAKRGDVQERRSARGSVAALRERADAGGYAVESLELRLVGAQIDLMDGKSANATRDAEGVAEAAETLGLGLIAKRARDVLAANAR